MTTARKARNTDPTDRIAPADPAEAVLAEAWFRTITTEAFG